MVHTRALWLTAALAGLSAVNAIPTIEVKGSKFFTSEGNQFYVKGIAYQLVPDDPLIDATQCGLDASLMKTIGTNSIRVYHVDPKADHTDCMKAFADAGIYIWLDLDTFDTQIEQTGPRWNETQRDAFAAVMDEFHQYDNLAGFFVGNEVLTTSAGSPAAPYVKAAARDLKAHRTAKGYRNIPVGYSAADIASLRPMLQNYLACGSNASESLDFFSLNAYSWCGSSSYMQSGYNMLEQNATNLHIPIFLSETGCNTVRPRDFKDQEAIYGEMSEVWSGSIVYEWIEEANNYGLIKYGEKVDPSSPNSPPDGFTRSGTPTPIVPDFANLGSVWKTLSPSGIKASVYTPTNQPVACPDFTSGAWEVNPTSALPSLGQVYSSQPTGSSTPRSSPTGSGTGQASPSTSPGAAPESLSRELTGMSAALVGAMAFFAWL
ncbi:hypothetical protein IQ07DRAFT_576258 [Pyrenochaeta sp. DS3sAY3a]|nr:hypothetical protein IQ07DRAFT_576258 [Pyrenochaeta sp. DS3sAY3a]